MTNKNKNYSHSFFFSCLIKVLTLSTTCFGVILVKIPSHCFCLGGFSLRIRGWGTNISHQYFPVIFSPTRRLLSRWNSDTTKKYEQSNPQIQRTTAPHIDFLRMVLQYFPVIFSPTCRFLWGRGSNTAKKYEQSNPLIQRIRLQYFPVIFSPTRRLLSRWGSNTAKKYEQSNPQILRTTAPYIDFLRMVL